MTSLAAGAVRFVSECFRRMGMMKLAFEHSQSGDGTGSRERSDERRRDEEAWSRMDDEGCPNGGPQTRAGAVGGASGVMSMA